MDETELPLVRPANDRLGEPSGMPVVRSPLDRRSGPTKFTVNIPESYPPQTTSTYPPKQGIQTKASRWSTIEFKVYGVVFAIVVPLMIWIPIRLSQASHPNFPFYQNRLSKGWLFGRQIDISDPQYRSFRGNIPSLLGLAVAHLASSRVYTHLVRPLYPSMAPTTFLCAFNVVLMAILHGTNAIKVLSIVFGNFLVSRWATSGKRGAQGKAGIAAIWIYNVAIIFANDYFEGYRFGDISERFDFMDRYQGLLPRWHIHFNMTMLRLISFGMDRYWAAKPSTSQTSGQSQTKGVTRPPSAHKERVRTSLPHEDYSLTNLVAYTLYPPLYIAGPIMTFNDFIWQIRHPIPSATKNLIHYAVRFLSCLLTMEFVLHFMYVVAIKDTGSWGGDSPAELSMVGFWNLIVVWLKLLIPWRFFRLWALADGMDPPENMVRCMANNYSCNGFWRSWHRSYNLWVVRYIYVPLGGSKNVVLATLLVFTFVALWHDLSFRLLTWGWLVSLFILPELVAGKMVPKNKYGNTGWYRHVAAVGAVLNVLMMMTANLVGFVIGVDGVRYLAEQLISSSDGVQFTVFSCACLFVAVQVMFEYRETELRQGIQRRC